MHNCAILYSWVKRCYGYYVFRIHQSTGCYTYVYYMFCSPYRLTRDLSFNIYYIPIGYHNHCYFILLQQLQYYNNNNNNILV